MPHDDSTKIKFNLADLSQPRSAYVRKVAAAHSAKMRGEQLHSSSDKMRQDPKVFYSRDDANGGLTDVLSVPFTAQTLSRAGINVEGNDLWRMAEQGWLRVLPRGTHNTHKGRFLWYERINKSMDIEEMLQLLDAQNRLR